MVKPLPLAVGALAITVAVVVGGCTAYRLEESRDLAAATTPYSVERPGASARLLIVGDSTAPGTGASTPERSLAGQLAVAMPQLSIVNLGTVGARYADVILQLERTPAPRYDVVLILAGGNDVIRLTAEAALRADIEAVAIRASALAPLVIVMPAGNVGNAPFFFFPWSSWMTARSQTLHALVREIAREQGLAYVNLYKPKAEDPFARQPGLLHAADGLHPSDEGYTQWLVELLAQSPLSARIVARH